MHTLGVDVQDDLQKCMHTIHLGISALLQSRKQTINHDGFLSSDCGGQLSASARMEENMVGTVQRPSACWHCISAALLKAIALVPNRNMSSQHILVLWTTLLESSNMSAQDT